MIHAWPQPLAGDIVWCHFPEDLTVIPADKPRPGLILEVYSDHAPQYAVLVAYGTSQKVNQLFSGEFAITAQDGSAFTIAGLSYPTKFKNTYSHLRKNSKLAEYFSVKSPFFCGVNWNGSDRSFLCNLQSGEYLRLIRFAFKTEFKESRVWNKGRYLNRGFWIQNLVDA